MLKSFYDFLANDLIIDYFNSTKIINGDRYYLIIENSIYRNDLLNALKKYGHDIVISNIYDKTNFNLKEESYSTFFIKTESNHPNVIIGDNQSATEDYLTTMRNVVGMPDTDYENFSVLYILSDKSSSSILTSSLDSITTACLDLQSENGPLNPKYIINKLEEKINNIINSKESMYMKIYLNHLGDAVLDGRCTLFDFQYALNIIQEGTLKGHFNEIGFIEDNSIYENSFMPNNSELEERILQNQSIFEKLNKIMQIDEINEKKSALQKLLDEKLTERLCESENWQSWLVYQDIIESVARKEITANLELLDYKLVNQGLLSDIIASSVGNKKKSKNYYIICDETNDLQQTIKLIFNKPVKKNEGDSEVGIRNNCASIKIKDEVIVRRFGVEDNYHEFTILRLPFNKKFFSDIHNYLTISKKGEIIISLPEDKTNLKLGNGINLKELPFNSIIDWEEDSVLEFNFENETKDRIDFSINKNGKKYNFIIKLNSAKALPPVTPDLIKKDIWNNKKVYQAVSNDNTHFFKIICDDLERSIVDYWRYYLELEYKFIESDTMAYNVVIDDSNSNEKIIPLSLRLPSEVRFALCNIFEYYRNNNTVPSLTYVNEELQKLYQNYIISVFNCISNIPTTRCLSPEEYDLMKLGVVIKGSKIILSPFHPLMIAFVLELKKNFDTIKDQNNILDLITPNYLMPFMFFKDEEKKVIVDPKINKLQAWLLYDSVYTCNNVMFNKITSEMVAEKIQDFIGYFKYLFQDNSCPIVINSIGIDNDEWVIAGIVEFIKNNYKKGVQNIELHEYVQNINEESFFEKLSRLNSFDAIIREFETLRVPLESKNNFESNEIIHCLFTKVEFFKHKVDSLKDEINYSHITFYHMTSSKGRFIPVPSYVMRSEMSLDGLISVDSATYQDGNYYVGFGTKGIKNTDSWIYKLSIAMNNLYANERVNGLSQYQKNTCVAKVYPVDSDFYNLLDVLYDMSSWVTFISPEVDINFFYGRDLYIIHSTDQFSINAKYDCITVTKHVDMYENMLHSTYTNSKLDEEHFNNFNKTMLNYFNCLNGNWLLDIISKTEVQIREKMSIVASCIAMKRIMSRNHKVIWLPIALDEILRVSGSVGLTKDFIFTKKNLGVKGHMSDDLLMLGLDYSNEEDITLYFYPVEVKASTYTAMTNIGSIQVSETYKQLNEYLICDNSFCGKVYRTFFASQFLNNADKFYSNKLLSEEEYKIIEKFRFELLNLKFSFKKQLPFLNLGQAAIVSFFSDAEHTMKTKISNEGIAVCQVHLPLDEIFRFIAYPEKEYMNYLENAEIEIDLETIEFLKNISNNDQILEEEPSDVAYVSTNSIDDGSQVISNEKNNDHSKEMVDRGQTSNENSKIISDTNHIDLYQGIRIIVGNTIASNRQIYFEPCNTQKVSHPNFGIVGTMGTGKTQFARSLIAQISKEKEHNIDKKPVGLLVFDYKGDYIDDTFLKSCDGESHKSNYPFNPLKLVVNEEAEGVNLPAITADRISDSFAKAYNLGTNQRTIIKETIKSVYEKAGITRDPNTWNKPVPTMKDVVNAFFANNDKKDSVYAIFDNLRDYEIFTDNNDKCVSLFEWLNGVKVIDLTLYSDDTKKMIVSLILDLFYAEMKQLGGSKLLDGFRQLRAMIMVDEAHQFLKKNFNSLRNIISEGRMFGVGMILSTQNISDFDNSNEDYSKYILSWAIHHVTNTNNRELANIFGNADKHINRYMDYINQAKIFESVCKIGSSVEAIEDLTFFKLIDADERFKK